MVMAKIINQNELIFDGCCPEIPPAPECPECPLCLANIYDINFVQEGETVYIVVDYFGTSGAFVRLSIVAGNGDELWAYNNGDYFENNGLPIQLELNEVGIYFQGEYHWKIQSSVDGETECATYQTSWEGYQRAWELNGTHYEFPDAFHWGGDPMANSRIEFWSDPIGQIDFNNVEILPDDDMLEFNSESPEEGFGDQSIIILCAVKDDLNHQLLRLVHVNILYNEFYVKVGLVTYTCELDVTTVQFKITNWGTNMLPAGMEIPVNGSVTPGTTIFSGGGAGVVTLLTDLEPNDFVTYKISFANVGCSVGTYEATLQITSTPTDYVNHSSSQFSHSVAV